jgi:hypothetical protein
MFKVSATFQHYTIMNKTLNAVKRGVKAAVTETFRPRQFEAGGKSVVCSHCGNEGFRWHGHGLAGTRFKPFAGGFVLECCQCSHLEHFSKKPAEIESKD